jgi:hypothetical protein
VPTDLSELQQNIIVLLSSPARPRHGRWPDGTDTMQITRAVKRTVPGSAKLLVLTAMESLERSGLAERIGTTTGHSRHAVWRLTTAGLNFRSAPNEQALGSPQD